MIRFLFALVFTICSSAAVAALKIGDVAPDFTITAAKGGKDFSFALKDALKQGPVVLYFYPKSFTSVCTVEAHEFAEVIDQFAQMGASVIGLSGDTIETQREFSKSECRDKFPVGADANLSVAKAYDAAFSVPVAGPMFASRITYVIAPDGKILSAFESASAQKHIENALATVRAWREAQPQEAR